MAKQGEGYERFVQDVYKVLNENDGLKNVVIQHNVKLKGISREHQIDVYWEFTFGTVTYRVAIECKDYSKPVTAEKIEAFRATLLDLGNVQGIYAARNGFQSGAVEVAKTYGIQLMQIREPIENDWDGYIKEINIEMTFVSPMNVRPIVQVDGNWAIENGIDEEKTSHFSGMADQVFVIVDMGLPSETKVSMHDMIHKLPIKKEGNNQTYSLNYENAFLECGDACVKIKGIDFQYDVRYSHDHLHIDAMSMAKAVVNNIISGTSKLIDIRNKVRDFGPC